MTTLSVPAPVETSRNMKTFFIIWAGQLISITARHGGVRVQSVARAMEGGTYGQAIRVRNEATREILQVTLTGPQQAVMGPTPVAVAQ